MNSIPVKALQDYNGHWYVIPNEKVKEFQRLCELSKQGGEYAYDAHTELVQMYGEFMIGGDLNKIQLYIGKTLAPPPFLGKKKKAK